MNTGVEVGKEDEKQGSAVSRGARSVEVRGWTNLLVPCMDMGR